MSLTDPFFLAHHALQPEIARMVVRRNGRATLAGKIFVATISVPANIIGLLLAKWLPANPDLYLDNAIILTKLPGGAAP